MFSIAAVPALEAIDAAVRYVGGGGNFLGGKAGWSVKLTTHLILVPKLVWRLHSLVRSKAHCLDNRLTVNCEILATCSSTYSPIRTSLEAHSVSIK
jgi:hypothetical protein